MSPTSQESTALTVAHDVAHTVVHKHQPARDVSAFQMLPCRLTLEISIPGFTVAALLRLNVNDVIDTRWLQGSDVPLRVNGTLIGWTEFEVIDDHLAARLTQIA